MTKAKNNSVDSVSPHFSAGTLASIFEVRINTADRCMRRESATLEFKENFHLSEEVFARISKTMAAFTNNRGGYLVFGVTPSPHILKGMTNDKFDKMDPQKLTQFLASHFQPSIAWDSMIYEKDSRRFGIIYVFPHPHPPVVATAPCANCFRDGEVLFRYAGESRSIKSADLLEMITERIQKEHRSWQQTLERMASIGPENAYLIDGRTGKLDAGSKALVIDPALIDKIKWIKEGHFVESAGSAALRLVGEVHSASGSPIVATRTVSKAVTPETLISSFLSSSCSSPKEFLEAIPFMNSIYFPIWFFIRQADMTLEQAVASLRNRRFVSKTRVERIVKRLEMEEPSNLAQGSIIDGVQVPQFKSEKMFKKDLDVFEKNANLPKTRSRAILRTAIFKILSERRGFDWPDDFWDEYRNAAFEAITHFKPDAVKELKDELLAFVKRMWQTELSSHDLSIYRRTLCYLDIIIYRPSKKLVDKTQIASSHPRPSTSRRRKEPSVQP